MQKDQRQFVGTALLYGPGQQVAGSLQVTSLVRGDTLMKTLLRLALTFGQGASGTLNVGTCATVTPFEERHARPDVDRLFVVATKVVIETRQQ